MKMEAIRVENGFFIPSNETLEKVKEDKIIIDVEIPAQKTEVDGYAILDEMIGFCESNRSDASVNHDEIIYELKTKL